MSDRLRTPRPALWAAVTLAVLAYLPALTAAPGRMPADSKLYLYLDPGRFLGDAASTFDPRQFAGWVPHQHVAYLWPSGPWFWLFDAVGFPDWIAHRLWIGTLMLLAGLGVRWCARVLGLGQVAALVAAVVYQVSPYVLPYVSRTSVMLLPWAGLGWIVALTVRATRRRSWHDPALIALVVFTVGAVNATALAMIVPAPVLWLLHATWQRSVSWRDAIAIAGRVTLLTVPVSLWWMVMLVVQGRYGAEVLPYSESLADVSLTATGPEVWRSLGYWLFYVRDGELATTSESLRYLSSTPTIALSYLLPIIGLIGLAFVHWAHRRFAMLLVVAGAVLAVGVHPIADRSPLMRLLAGDDAGGLALALRSSTRALPMMNLGLALGVAVAVGAIGTTHLPRIRIRTHHFAGVLVIVLAVANLPSLWTGGFVDPAIDRDQDPPAAWTEAAAALDATGSRSRVLQLPGAEFGAFGWGYTVDQPLPGLTDKPLVTRDLLPLGSPGAMDLLYAFDDRIQDGVLEPDSVAPVARWLGVDTVWVARDLDVERFRTADPAAVDAVLDGAPGVGPARDFGTPTPEVSLRPIEPAGTVVRAGARTVVVSGSGDGLVDLAASGLLDGTETVRYSASLDDGGDAAVTEVTPLLVTDSNRDRERHWRSSQDTLGATESDQPAAEPLRPVASDQRLPVFAGRDEVADPATLTIARQVGPAIVTATSYGEPFAYIPEHRPVMAIDGDPATAWSVGEHADPIGEVLRITIEQPVAGIGLVQLDPGSGRRIVEVLVTADGGTAQRIALDDRSLTTPGQPVVVSATSVIDIEIAAVAGGTPFTAGAVQGVGFAEVLTGLAPTIEVVRPPHDALAVAAPETPLSIVLTRWRSDALDPWRSDPEPRLVRGFELPHPRTFDVTADVRIDPRAPDAALAPLFGWPVTASSRLTGSLVSAGASALDGDPATAWRTAAGGGLGATLMIDGIREPIASVTVTQPEGTSPITALVLRTGGEERSVSVGAGSESTVPVDPPLPPGRLEIEIAAVDPVVATDRRFGDLVELPAGIAEISIAGAPRVPRVADAEIVVECAPLLLVDGVEHRMTFTLAAGAATTGMAARATSCDGPTDLATGEHVVSAAPFSPVTVDRLMLDSGAVAALATGGTDLRPTVQVLRGGRFDREVEVTDCPDGCWLVVGEGYSTGWSASADGADLGEPVLVDGGFNGWWLTGRDSSTVVEVTWAPQRTLQWALWLSILGVVAALGIAALTRRAGLPLTVVPRPRWTWTTPTSTVVAAQQTQRRVLGVAFDPAAFETRAMALVLAWAGLSALLIQPEWAVWGTLAGFGVALWQRPRLPELTALASVVVVAALVVVRERRNAPVAGGGWPGVFEDWHGLAMFAVVSLLIGALTTDDAAWRRAPGVER